MKNCHKINQLVLNNQHKLLLRGILLKRNSLLRTGVNRVEMTLPALMEK